MKRSDVRSDRWIVRPGKIALILTYLEITGHSKDNYVGVNQKCKQSQKRRQRPHPPIIPPGRHSKPFLLLFQRHGRHEFLPAMRKALRAARPVADSRYG